MPIGKNKTCCGIRLVPVAAYPPLLVLLTLATWTGCSVWPFKNEQRTSIITPSMRISTIREMGARAAQADSDQQQRITDQLAQQIRTEPDPLVRLSIQETVAEFDTSLAQMILLAGLNDTDRDVRMVCCRKLGQRAAKSDSMAGHLNSVAELKRVLQQDEDIDVRFAAIDALGQISGTESIQALSVALHDRNPAMQYAGVQALKQISGQDFGNEVESWRQYADGENPQILPTTSIAQKVKGMIPFK
jgi:hypothetical protein